MNDNRKSKVYITEHIHPEAEELLSEHVELDVGVTNLSKAELLERVAEATSLRRLASPHV